RIQSLQRYTQGMSADDQVDGLVNRIYDAAVDAHLWPAFLDDFASTVRGSSTVILFYDGSPANAKVSAVAVRADPHYIREYRDHYDAINPWLKSWKTRLNQAGPASIGTSEERVELASLYKTEFYNDYLLPQDTIHQLGCMITKTEDSASGFACLRSRRAGPFGDVEIKLLRAL